MNSLVTSKIPLVTPFPMVSGSNKKNNLYTVSDDIFKKIMSYLPIRDCASLRAVKSISESDRILQIHKEKFSDQISALGSVLSCNISESENLKESSQSTNIPLITQQAWKLIESTDNLQEMEQHFMEFLGKLLNLTRESENKITAEHFEQQKQKFSNSAYYFDLLKNLYLNLDSSEEYEIHRNPSGNNANDPNLIKKFGDSFSTIQLLKKQGTTYFPLIEQFFYNMPSSLFQRLSDKFIMSFFKNFLETNQVTKAIDFCNALTKKHWTPEEIKDDYRHKLHTMIIKFCVAERDLSTAIEVLQAILKSEDFRKTGLRSLSYVITLALEEAKYREISEFLEKELKNLELHNEKLMIIQDEFSTALSFLQMHINNSNQEIVKAIRFVSNLSQKKAQIITLETIMERLLGDDNYRKDLSQKKIRKAIYNHTIKITVQQSMDSFFGESEKEPEFEARKARYEEYKKLEENAYFKFLSSSMMELFLKKDSPLNAAALFSIMGDSENGYKLISYYVKNDDFLNANHMVQYISDKDQQLKLKEKIKNVLNTENKAIRKLKQLLF